MSSLLHIKRRVRHWRTDHYLLSYPKCGRTWLRLMLAGVFQRHFEIALGDPLKLHRAAHRRRSIPRIEATHDWKTPGLPMARQRVHRDKSGFRRKGVILLVRDPRDVIVSNYFQKIHRDEEFEGSLSEFLHDEVFGLHRVVEYYNTWADQRHIPATFTLVRYEDLLGDTMHELNRVVATLGIAPVADDILRETVDACSFANMRAMESGAGAGPGQLRPADGSDVATYKTRSGKSGGYREHVAPEQARWMDEVIDSELCDFFNSYHSAGTT